MEDAIFIAFRIFLRANFTLKERTFIRSKLYLSFEIEYTCCLFVFSSRNKQLTTIFGAHCLTRITFICWGFWLFLIIFDSKAFLFTCEHYFTHVVRSQLEHNRRYDILVGRTCLVWHLEKETEQALHQVRLLKEFHKFIIQHFCYVV